MAFRVTKEINIRFASIQLLFSRFFLSQETKTASYANHDTPYVSAENIDKLISSLEEESKTLFKRLADNRLKAKSDECHLPVSGTQKSNVKTEHFCIDNSERDKS